MLSPALVLAVPFLAGTAASIVFLDGLPRDFALACAAGSLLCWLAALTCASLADAGQACVCLVAGALLCGGSLGAADAIRAYQSPLGRWFELAAPPGPVIVEGVLRADGERTPGGATVLLDVHAVRELLPGGGAEGESHARQISARGGIRLSIGGALADDAIGQWRKGRTIRAPAFLRRPATYLNPGTPDERRALARRGIALVGSVKSAALVEVASRGRAFDEAAGDLRSWTRRRLASRIGFYGARSSGLATAVLIGDRSGLAIEDERRLQEAGTYHVIAISGGNIAILAVLLTVLWRVLLIRARSGALLTAGLLLFYGSVAGGAASVSRAVTVAIVVLVARAMDHRAAPVNSLAVAAAAAVAASPVVVLDAGFILSFGATLGILLGLRCLPFTRLVPRSRASLRPRVLEALVLLSAATVCAEIVLAPVAATLFWRVSFAGLLLNLIAIPLMTLVQIGGLVAAAAPAFLDSVGRLSGLAVHGAATALLGSARLVDVAPWLAPDVPPPALWLIAAYYLSAAGLLCRRTRRAASVGLGILATVLIAGPHVVSRHRVPASPFPLRVGVLDVGQGDATVVSLPGGHALLVDSGGLAPFAPAGDNTEAPGFDVGERVVSRALRALGVSRLEALVISHGDPDHLLGAKGVLRHTPARSVWEGVPVPPHAGIKGLFDLARSRAITWRVVQAGDAERFGDVEIRVLHPPLPEWERQRVRNEDSIVLEIRLGDVSIILPGDIGREGERAIVPRLERGRLTILKAPHHGSASSSTAELLDALRPAAVIFSCGRDNRFGHPHPAVVQRYRAQGAAIFSTAEDGAVFVESDGATARVSGWTGRVAELRRLTPSR